MRSARIEEDQRGLVYAFWSSNEVLVSVASTGPPKWPLKAHGEEV